MSTATVRAFYIMGRTVRRGGSSDVLWRLVVRMSRSRAEADSYVPHHLCLSTHQVALHLPLPSTTSHRKSSCSTQHGVHVATWLVSCFCLVGLLSRAVFQDGPNSPPKTLGNNWHKLPHTPQPFYGSFSGTTRVSRCQKRPSGLYGARED